MVQMEINEEEVEKMIQIISNKNIKSNISTVDSIVLFYGKVLTKLCLIIKAYIIK